MPTICFSRLLLPGCKCCWKKSDYLCQLAAGQSQLHPPRSSAVLARAPTTSLYSPKQLFPNLCPFRKLPTCLPSPPSQLLTLLLPGRKSPLHHQQSTPNKAGAQQIH